MRLAPVAMVLVMVVTLARCVQVARCEGNPGDCPDGYSCQSGSCVAGAGGSTSSSGVVVSSAGGSSSAAGSSGVSGVSSGSGSGSGVSQASSGANNSSSVMGSSSSVNACPQGSVCMLDGGVGLCDAQGGCVLCDPLTTNACAGNCTLTASPGSACDSADDLDTCVDDAFTCTADLNSVTCTNLVALDEDGDNYASGPLPMVGDCQQDCDDQNPNSHPNRAEECNNKDDNCNQTVDEGANPCGGACTITGAPGVACDLTSPDGGNRDTCFDDVFRCVGLNAIACQQPVGRMDLDGDGYLAVPPGALAVDGGFLLATGDGGTGVLCNQYDCNDGVATMNPGLTEVLGNTIDDNCNGLIDELTNACGGMGVLNPAQLPGQACDSPSDPDDCQDDTFVCTGIDATACMDQDNDLDGDTFTACVGVAIADCDDTRVEVSPVGVEVCDMLDNNCDGVVDEAGTGQTPNACGGICPQVGGPALNLPCDSPDDLDTCVEDEGRCAGPNTTVCLNLNDQDQDRYSFVPGTCLADCNDLSTYVNPGVADRGSVFFLGDGGVQTDAGNQNNVDNDCDGLLDEDACPPGQWLITTNTNVANLVSLSAEVQKVDGGEILHVVFVDTNGVRHVTRGSDLEDPFGTPVAVSSIRPQEVHTTLGTGDVLYAAYELDGGAVRISQKPPTGSWALANAGIVANGDTSAFSLSQRDDGSPVLAYNASTNPTGLYLARRQADGGWPATSYLDSALLTSHVDPVLDYNSRNVEAVAYLRTTSLGGSELRVNSGTGRSTNFLVSENVETPFAYGVVVGRDNSPYVIFGDNGRVRLAVAQPDGGSSLQTLDSASVTNGPYHLDVFAVGDVEAFISFLDTFSNRTELRVVQGRIESTSFSTTVVDNNAGVGPTSITRNNRGGIHVLYKNAAGSLRHAYYCPR